MTAAINRNTPRVTEEKREAQELALKGFLGPAFSFSTPKNPNLGKKEEVKPVIN